jgi:predicted RNA-binding protein with PUA domain
MKNIFKDGVTQRKEDEIDNKVVVVVTQTGKFSGSCQLSLIQI